MATLPGPNLEIDTCLWRETSDVQNLGASSTLALSSGPRLCTCSKQKLLENSNYMSRPWAVTQRPSPVQNIGRDPFYFKSILAHKNLVSSLHDETNVSTNSQKALILDLRKSHREGYEAIGCPERHSMHLRSTSRIYLTSLAKDCWQNKQNSESDCFLILFGLLPHIMFHVPLGPSTAMISFILSFEICSDTLTFRGHWQLLPWGFRLGGTSRPRPAHQNTFESSCITSTVKPVMRNPW